MVEAAKARKLSPVSYVLALLCFLLPFVQVSCGGQKLFSFTGVQLMTGTTIKLPTELLGLKDNPNFKAPNEAKLDANPAAIIAFLAGLAGLAFAFVKMSRAGVISGVAGGVAAAALFFLRVSLSSKLQESGGPNPFSVEYQNAYYVSLLAFIFGGALAIRAEMNTGARRSAPAGEGSALPPGGSTVCANCGATLRTRFCGACGTWAPRSPVGSN